MREALRLFEAYHLAQQAHLNALKADIDRGIADMNAGQVALVGMADIKLQ
jgi:antitoxin ParD1/3/4